MSLRVRTPDGELAFETWRDVEESFRQGLISPEDEILEDGKLPRRAGAHPLLRHTRRESSATSLRSARRVMALVLLGGAALYFVLKQRWAPALVFAIIVSAFATVLAYKANRLKKPK